MLSAITARMATMRGGGSHVRLFEVGRVVLELRTVVVIIVGVCIRLADTSIILSRGLGMVCPRRDRWAVPARGAGSGVRLGRISC